MIFLLLSPGLTPSPPAFPRVLSTPLQPGGPGHHHPSSPSPLTPSRPLSDTILTLCRTWLRPPLRPHLTPLSPFSQFPTLTFLHAQSPCSFCLTGPWAGGALITLPPPLPVFSITLPVFPPCFPLRTLPPTPDHWHLGFSASFITAASWTEAEAVSVSFAATSIGLSIQQAPYSLFIE